MMAALSMFVMGTGCSSGVTSPSEPSASFSAVWLANGWEITDLSDPDRTARSWSFVCRPLTCSVFWLSATQDSFEIGSTTPPHTVIGTLGHERVIWTSVGLNQGSLALHGTTRATLTSAGPAFRDPRLPTVWEAMVESNVTITGTTTTVLTVEGTGTWSFSGEDQPVPARMVVRLRRCPDRWMNGSHGLVSSWCIGFDA